jgi:hypothetical protein
MPIRIASFTQRLSRNGQALHRAAASRMASHGADSPPSEAEAALLQEREALKQQRAERQARAAEPRPTAAERLVRTHHAEARDTPKPTAGGKDAKAPKSTKPHRSRAEKAAAKAAALDAARRSPKKPAKG